MDSVLHGLPREHAASYPSSRSGTMGEPEQTTLADEGGVGFVSEECEATSGCTSVLAVGDAKTAVVASVHVSTFPSYRSATCVNIDLRELPTKRMGIHTTI